MQLLQVVEQQIATMQQQQQLVHADHYHRAQATGLQQLQIPQHPQQSYYAHEPNSISPVSPIDYQHEQQQALMRMAMANEASQVRATVRSLPLTASVRPRRLRSASPASLRRRALRRSALGWRRLRLVVAHAEPRQQSRTG